eukprot:450639-Pleurochrysis_carterae.AAC.1
MQEDGSGMRSQMYACGRRLSTKPDSLPDARAGTFAVGRKREIVARKLKLNLRTGRQSCTSPRFIAPAPLALAAAHMHSHPLALAHYSPEQAQNPRRPPHSQARTERVRAQTNR